MTISQAQMLLAAVERRISKQRLGEAVCMRMAQTDAKSFKAYCKALEGVKRGSRP